MLLFYEYTVVAIGAATAGCGTAPRKQGRLSGKAFPGFRWRLFLINGNLKIF